MDKPDKVMSQEYDIIYVNEVPELSQEDWENLTTRARYGVMPYQQVGGDCNPHGPGHWLYKRAQAGKTVMLFSVHQDNPALFDAAAGQWTEQGAAYLAKLEALTGFRRDRLLLGKWTAAEGAVYPGFNRQDNVREVDCDGWSTLLALDMGTRNPTAILTIRHAGDRIHVERERYERGMSSDSITDAAEKAYAGSGATHLVIDPSAAGLIRSLENRGVKVRKGDNDVKVGISRLTSILPDLTVDPSCVNLIDEFETYRYPSGGRRYSNDTPIKEFDHALDALRYAVMDLTAPRRKVRIIG
jgi:phage terminase large subunit